MKSSLCLGYIFNYISQLKGLAKSFVFQLDELRIATVVCSHLMKFRSIVRIRKMLNGTKHIFGR